MIRRSTNHATVRSLALLGALLCVSPSMSAANPDLDDAKRAIDELDFEVARARLDRALRWGKNTPAQIREIQRLAGEISAALGDDAAAENFFYQMLTLDPSARLPAGSSPKLTAPFNRAQQRVRASGGLSARCEVDADGPTLNVHIDADPAELVAGARAVYRMGEGMGEDQAAAADNAQAQTQTVEASGRHDIALALPASSGLAVYCAVIDQHGNHLVEIGSAADPLPWASTDQATHDTTGADADLTNAGPGDSMRVPSQSLPAHWATWGSLSVAGAAAGGYFAWRVRADQSALDDLNQASAEHDFTEAKALEDRGRRHALVANISFAVAGAFAVVSVVQFIRRPRAESSGERSASSSFITPVPMPGGAGVAVHASF